MRLQDAGVNSRRILTILLLSMVLLLVASSALTQDSPVMQGLRVARELVEEDRGAPLRLVRWRFYEDNWSSEASVQMYGAFGIDSCAAGIPFARKRATILFGWTYSLLDASGKEYQARVSYDLAHSVVCDEVRIPPQYAPEPTPVPPPAPEPAPEAAAETAAQPAESQAVAVAPIASTANVGGFELGGHIAGLGGNTVGALRQAGMTWVKKQVKFGENDGIGLIGEAHAQGFKVLLGALGNKDLLAGDFNGYIARYAEYLAWHARMGADAIEVWNEPNIDREWPLGQVNGGRYVQLLAAAYNAIKAANPNTIVISGAPAPTGYFGAAGCTANGCNDDVFMQQMAQAGGAQYMDCLGLHYNEGVLSPSQSGGDPRGHYPTYFFHSMLNRGLQYFPNTPVCWTELGYLSGEGMPGPIPSHFGWASNVSVAQQAQWLADATRLSRNSGRVRMLIVWNVDFTHWGADPQAGYAIIRPGGGCPACGTLRAAMGG